VGCDTFGFSLSALDINGPENYIYAIQLKIQVEEADTGVEPVELSLDFVVDSNVCDGLCARTFQLTMAQAVRTADGGISETVERIVLLDCSDDGDPALCPATADAAVEEPMEPDAATMPDAAPPATDITALTAALSDGLGAAHDALCTSCSDPNRIPCYAIVPLGAISCIETALTDAAGTPELAQALQALVDEVEAVTAECSACDLEACAPPLLDAALSEFPAQAQSAIAACLGD
jgi:hypothetical protein